MSLSNIQIEIVARYYGLPLRAVCLRDGLARLHPLPGGYVVNLQSSRQGDGTHWCLLYIHPTAGNFWVDPFGADCPTAVTLFLRGAPNHRFYYNQSIYQDLNSDLCGWYALGLLMALKRASRAHPAGVIERWINMFHAATALNAGVLKNYYRTYPIAPPGIVQRCLFPPGIK